MLKNTLRTSWLMGLVFLLGFGAKAQNASQTLPQDPNVRMGKLENGITYYIKKNQEPENRAELRLAVSAGSMQENDDQQGLAHFCEHMCFNGSEHFEKNELVDYLESIGTKFGAHLNAYTSFDETVYMLQVPTDDEAIMDKSFLVLEDWAHGVTFEDEEIDKERGVVIEEWRLGQGAQERMRKAYFPVLFHNSRYADRLPIGKKNILETFEYQTIRDFYHDWYRPDLMAVIVVGDVDVDDVEKKIKDHFADIKPVENPRKKQDNTVPNHEGTKIVVAKDKEAPVTLVQMLYKKPFEPVQTEADYKKRMVSGLYEQMLNSRLMEMVQQSDPPFSQPFVFSGNFVKGSSFFGMGALLDPSKVIAGTEALYTEAERASRFGFTESEFGRAKKSMMSQMKQAYNNRNTTESRKLVQEYIDNFLEGQAFPGIEWEYQYYQNNLEGISLADVNAYAKTTATEDNAVILVMAPEAADIPEEEEVMEAYLAVRENKSLTAYEDNVSDAPLIKKMPKAGAVTETNEIKEIGVTEWTLSNGAKVVIKPTDFKDDEILFWALSPGGTSKASDANFLSALNAADIISESGLGGFDRTALDKKLTGVNVELTPWIKDLHEGFDGKSSRADFETMLKMVYLYCTAPRKDTEAFQAWQSRMKSQYASMGAAPEQAFGDSITARVYDHHPRKPVITAESFDQVDLQEAWMFFYDRFSDVSDFTFIIVGNVDPAKDKAMIEQYLGGISSFKRKESWKDREIGHPAKRVETVVRRGTEPKSMVSMTFHNEMEWSRQEIYTLKAMGKVLSIMMRESMREEKGGVYGVSAYPRMTRFPEPEFMFGVFFGCSPDNVDDLIATAHKEIKTLQDEGPSKKNLAKVKEILRREREMRMRENKFWQQFLAAYYERGEDPRALNDFDALLEGITAKSIQKAARKYFDFDKYVEVVLKPEE